MTAGLSIPTYPCDRGMPSNVLARGYHEFHVTAHGTCCRLCGKPPLHEPLQKMEASSV